MCLACNKEFQEDIAKCPHDGTSLISLRQEDEWIGRTLLDRYDVTELLGKGGMGVVYLARQRMMDRWVAIKMLQAELTQDDVSVKRFQQEAKAASCLNHPHLVTLHDYGITPTGQPFLVMEYLQGRSLLEVIKRIGPLAPHTAVKIFSQVADGLAHAHHQGIVHRDLKPSNILLIDQEDDPEFVKVVDFGLAKLMPWSGKESQHLTKTGEVFGSPIYMSPEQCMGRELRPTSDIYSLGITLFEALTGKPPFRGVNSIATASKHMSEAPPRLAEIRPELELPEALEKVVLTSLAKDPSARFQDMGEFRDALQSSISKEKPTATKSSRSHAFEPSTVAIPVYKQEQDVRKSTSQRTQAVQPNQPAGPPKNLIVILCAVAAVFAAGSGSIWYLTQGQPFSGVVWGLSAENHQLTLRDSESGKLKTYQLSQQQQQKLGSAETGSRYIGRNVDGSIDRLGNIKDVEFSGDPDSELGAAFDALSEFLEDVASQDDVARAASRLKSATGSGQKDNETKLSAINAAFPFDQRRPRVGKVAIQNIASDQTGRPHQANEVPTRDPGCIAVEEVIPAKRTVIFRVQKAAYLTNGNGNWRFTVDLGATPIDKPQLSFADE
jgi:serine/threonine protein kinase